MKLESVKDLETLIRMCRKQGVSSIKIDNIELELGEPVKPARRAKDDGKEVTEQVASDEELLFWSANNG